MTAQASLVAAWLAVGFVHGVMNTDNCSISGETIDYGPCAFLDAYDPKRPSAPSTAAGRYAFANQPRIAQWNLARLAEALLPLVDADESRAAALLEERLETFSARFEAAYAARLRASSGCARPARATSRSGCGCSTSWPCTGWTYTLAFRRLCDLADGLDRSLGALR
jgi:uncharacterized protein YdiU (UPF0061 family)